MRHLNSFLTENAKSVSVTYLKGLLKNVTNKSARKFITNWITRSDKKMVHLSDKEYNILDLIKKGGPYPKDFSTKN